MKKCLLALVVLHSAPLFAEQGGFFAPQEPRTSINQEGGFVGPSVTLTTVDNLGAMKDGSWVILKGNIEMRVSDDTYTFRDATGTVSVEIDNKYWNGQSITPKDTVQLEGKLDKSWGKVEVDVKKVKKLP